MDCLITKLKGAVSDNSIPKFGILKFEVREREGYVMTTPTNKQCCISLKVTEETTIKVVGEGGGISFTLSDVTTNPENLQQELTITPGDYNDIYCKYGNYDLEIQGNVLQAIKTLYSYNGKLNGDFCYVGINLSTTVPNLTLFQVNGSIITGTIDSFKGNTVLGYTVCGYNTTQTANSDNNAGLRGDVSSFGEATGITRITLAGKNYMGDISGLGTLTNLTYVNVAMLRPTGDIKDFIAVQKASGRSTCTDGIVTIRPFLRVKFYGQGENVGTFNRIKWDATKEWVEVSSTEEGPASKIYAHGATQSEIDAWTQQGIEVINVDV